MLTRQICNAYGGPRVQAKPLLHDQCCRVPVSGLGIILSPSLNGRPHPVTSSPTGPQGGPRGAPLLPSTAALQDRARLSENTAGRSGREDSNWESFAHWCSALRVPEASQRAGSGSSWLQVAGGAGAVGREPPTGESSGSGTDAQ